MINKTIKASGGDYNSFGAFVTGINAALLAVGGLTDSWTVTVENSFVDPGSTNTDYVIGNNLGTSKFNDWTVVVTGNTSSTFAQIPILKFRSVTATTVSESGSFAIVRCAVQSTGSNGSPIICSGGYGGCSAWFNTGIIYADIGGGAAVITDSGDNGSALINSSFVFVSNLTGATPTISSETSTGCLFAGYNNSNSIAFAATSTFNDSDACSIWNFGSAGKSSTGLWTNLVVSDPKFSTAIIQSNSDSVATISGRDSSVLNVPSSSGLYQKYSTIVYGQSPDILNKIRTTAPFDIGPYLYYVSGDRFWRGSGQSWNTANWSSSPTSMVPAAIPDSSASVYLNNNSGSILLDGLLVCARFEILGTFSSANSVIVESGGITCSGDITSPSTEYYLLQSPSGSGVFTTSGDCKILFKYAGAGTGTFTVNSHGNTYISYVTTNDSNSRDFTVNVYTDSKDSTLFVLGGYGGGADYGDVYVNPGGFNITSCTVGCKSLTTQSGTLTVSGFSGTVGYLGPGHIPGHSGAFTINANTTVSCSGSIYISHYLNNNGIINANGFSIYGPPIVGGTFNLGTINNCSGLYIYMGTVAPAISNLITYIVGTAATQIAHLYVASQDSDYAPGLNGVGVYGTVNFSAVTITSGGGQNVKLFGGSGVWYWNAPSTPTLTHASVQNCDARGGANINALAVSNVDLGGNHGFLFLNSSSSSSSSCSSSSFSSSSSSFSSRSSSSSSSSLSSRSCSSSSSSISGSSFPAIMKLFSSTSSMAAGVLLFVPSSEIQNFLYNPNKKAPMFVPNRGFSLETSDFNTMTQAQVDSIDKTFVNTSQIPGFVHRKDS